MTVGKVWLIIIFIILCIGIDVSNVINHEKVHKQIQLYYGCEESQTHYGLFTIYIQNVLNQILIIHVYLMIKNMNYIL